MPSRESYFLAGDDVMPLHLRYNNCITFASVFIFMVYELFVEYLY